MTDEPQRDDEDWAAWVASRPPQIQAAIRRFPPGMTAVLKGELCWLMGYTEGEDVGLIFSVVNPAEDYDRARRVENRRYVCAKHFDA